MSYFKRLWFAVATALSVSCVVADAGTCLAPKIDWRDYEWALITGNGKTACEEMLRYLKGRPKDRPLPVCPEDRLPTNGNWTRPAWQMLDDDQRQALLRDIPAEFADTPQAQELRKATVIKKARIDITRDGIPETLLAYGQGAARCERATHCAEADGDAKGYVVIPHLGAVEWYWLAAMDETGTRIHWNRQEFHLSGIVSRSGELVFYKKRPYWMSGINWDQSVQDNYKRYLVGPKNIYSRTFELAPLTYGKTDHDDPRTPTAFENVNFILPDENANCHFGYYHHENLKRTGPLKRQ